MEMKPFKCKGKDPRLVLQALRKALNMSQRELARACGCDHTSISNYELKLMGVSYVTSSKLAEFFATKYAGFENPAYFMLPRKKKARRS